MGLSCVLCDCEIEIGRARLGATRCHDHVRAGFVRADGYIREYDPDTKKVVYRHRRIAAEVLGRPLRVGEEVHHLNGNPSDNRPENLRVVTTAEHRFLTKSVLTDREIAELLLLGYGIMDIEARGVGNRRVINVRRRLGFPPKGSTGWHRGREGRMLALAKWERERHPKDKRTV